MKAFLIVIAILLIIGIIYYFNRNKINSLLGIKGLNQPSWVSCKENFYAKLPDGKTISVYSSNSGTDISPMIEFYKNEVTLTENGVVNAQVPVKINKEEFDSYCKYLFNPPYEWYTQKERKQ